MSIMKEEKNKFENNCWVCLRITPEYVLKKAHETFKENRELAREIGTKASSIIKECYAKKRVFFCGKHKGIVLGALFYLLGLQYNFPKSQREIARNLEVTDVALRNFSRNWLRGFPELFKDFSVTQATEFPWFYEKKFQPLPLKFKGKITSQYMSHKKRRTP